MFSRKRNHGMRHGTLALGLATTLAVGGCTAMEAPNNSKQSRPVRIDIDCINPSDRIGVAEFDTEQVDVEITNRGTGQVQQLSLRRSYYAMPGFADSRAQWRKLPSAGERIGALAINPMSPDFVAIASGEPDPSSHSNPLPWIKAGEAITAYCVHWPYNPNGYIVPVSHS